MTSHTTDDPFSFEDSLLNLEESFYQSGYAQGVSDGVKAGRTEGRQLGLEKGFQKFVASGRLHGRAIVWANRLPSKQSDRQHFLQEQSRSRSESQQLFSSSETQEGGSKPASDIEVEKKLAGLNLENGKGELPLLQNNARLQKHISTLFALVETDTLAKENTDEAVNDFDDRLKRAQGKAKIVERIVGEVSERKKVASTVATPSGESSGTGTGTPIQGVDLGRVGNEV
ncbi:hypothetical protein B0T20DRAFT_423322 [Sordaria brevicollis]|uniref:Essential protein Yae1 N-terminal domain-containing protein n=1 Tax=Sordaria brevicollis TaxID=83679 RepID=A0AAE0P2D3_SORBR|nr:hypothetical protein B0T20DRAFT_423322 [Sordaria brevicollis]